MLYEETPKTGFQETEIGVYPTDWSISKLATVAQVIPGQSPPATTYNVEGIGTPFFQGKAEFGLLYPTAAKWCNAPIKISELGDILISVRAPVGDVNLAPYRCCIGRGLAAIRSSRESHNLFIYYQLVHAKERLESEGTGSTFKGINKSILMNFLIPLPPLAEQRRIAAALNGIQDAIAAQDDLLRALREGKRSLMARLFTYGPGPSPAATKQTEVGEIPAHWECLPVKQVIAFSRKSRGLDLSKYEKIPFIPMDLISEQNTYITQYETRLPDEIKSGSYCERGDLLIAKITPSFENGKQGILKYIPLEFAYATTEVYALKPTAEKVDSIFLFYFFKLDKIRHSIASKMEGTTGRQRVPKNVLENHPVPIPSITEQRIISNILETIQKKIAAETDRKAALQALFRSALQQLMTGQIRLRDDALLS